jgi:broad specificity phosphatase PhoE
LQRARQTCDLDGFGAVAEIVPDLVEWNYGHYEDRRALGYENDLSRPFIRFWNDTRHVEIEPEVAAQASP